jgi:hypothetical protein
MFYEETRVQEHAAGRPEKIGRGIHHLGRTAGDEILVNFIADAIYTGGHNAQEGHMPELAPKP